MINRLFGVRRPVAAEPILESTRGGSLIVVRRQPSQPRHLVLSTGPLCGSTKQDQRNGKIYLGSFGPTYDQYPTVLIFKGLILDKTGKSKEGESILREAVKLRTDSLPGDHYWVAAANSALGKSLTTQKRFAEAEPLLLESYNALLKSQGPQNPRTLSAQGRLVELYHRWQKPELVDKYRVIFGSR